eukprot:TRINITY_DN31066_c0_g1_i1.p1 TRINITY_DN31066_c0_g1~~TRINITY_DN31066_c0_g1_i1.p1  ORF type:complete len:302 (-),score=49.00 TRINITY_DN31066_c0_g1_i1:55-960(-)
MFLSRCSRIHQKFCAALRPLSSAADRFKVGTFMAATSAAACSEALLSSGGKAMATACQSTSLESPAAFNGKRYLFEHKNVRVDVQQDCGRDASNDLDMTGDLVWPTAVIFCKFLCDRADLVQGRRVLDLGAGTGLVGLAAAQLGGHATLVDVPRVMPLLEHNASLACNASEETRKTSCAPLWWGDQVQTKSLLDTHGPFDVVIGCEVIYQHTPAVFDALRTTLQELLPRPGGTLVIVYQHRDGAEVTDHLFFESLLACGFDLEETIELGAWDESWDDVECRWVRIYKRRASPTIPQQESPL